MSFGPLFWFSRSPYWSGLRWFPKLLQQQVSDSTFRIAHMVAIALFISWCFSMFSFCLRQHYSHLILPHHYFFILSPYLLRPRYPVFPPLLHCRTVSSLRKQWRCYHWFPSQMTSEKRAQKFHTDDASLPRSGQCFWLVESNFPRGATNQYGIPTLVSQTSFGGETSGSVTKCRLFSQATL